MMKLIGKLFDHTCRVYTITAVLFLLLQMAIAGGADETVIRPEAFLLILPFAVIFALADLIYLSPRIALALRLLIHFVFVVAGACAFLYMPMMGADSPSSSVLTAVFGFAVAYWVCMVPYLLLSSAVRRLIVKRK
jgi:hypothetical protein